MNHDELPKWSAKAAQWARDYHATLRDRPVRPDVTPGSIRAQMPESAPENPEPMEQIFADFEAIVPDAMTHWQHPRFFAYFPSNAAPASMLAEQLANAISAMCMLWQTSPAATEIEQVMVTWLRDALGLPATFTGTIHDSATTATLSAILTMREMALDWAGNEDGLSGGPRLRIYASAQTHSSIDKGVRVAGVGQNNLVKVPTRPDLSMDPEALARAITEDRAAGFLPAGVILCSGGTSVGAFDDLAVLIPVAKAEGLMTHVDAAWAGNSMICPEFRHLWHGVEAADSVIFNPYKGIGAQFDGALQFVKDPRPQVRTLGLQPDYLVTLETAETTDFNEWTVPLGRRFRALKLWFLIRAHGLEGLRQKMRNHVAWVAELADRIAEIDGLEIVTEPRLALFSFAHKDGDASTEALIQKINADGRVYLTQTRHEGRFVIRMTAGSFDCTRDDVMTVETVLREMLG
jgi:aromatic-L-amino-acid decarboxylase